MADTKLNAIGNTVEQEDNGSVLDRVSEGAKTAGKIAVFATMVQTADAAEKLAGEVFIHKAGFEAQVGSMTLTTGIEDPNMQVVFEETDNGVDIRKLKGEVERAVFTGKLQRNEFGEWGLSEQAFFDIVKAANLEPPVEGRGGYEDSGKLATIDFDNIQEPNCKLLDKAEVGMRGILDCRKVSKDADKYTKDIEGITALAEEGKALDQVLVQQEQKIKELRAAKQVAEMAKKLAD